MKLVRCWMVISVVICLGLVIIGMIAGHFVPTGQIAYARFQVVNRESISEIFLMDVSKRLHIRLIESRGSNLGDMQDLTWSPDGERLAYTQSGRLYLLSINDRAIQPISSPNDRLQSDPQWSPDGLYIAFIAHGLTEEDNNLYKVDLGQRSQFYYLLAVIPAQDISWSPDGNFIAMLTDAPDLFWLDTRTYQLQGPLKHTGSASDSIGGWSGSHLIYPTYLEQLLYIAHIPTGENALLSEIIGIKNAVVSPDGQQVAYTLFQQVGLGIFQITNPPETPQILTAQVDSLQPFLNWSSDSQRLTYIFNSEINIINADGSNRQILTDDFKVKTYPVWRP